MMHRFGESYTFMPDLLQHFCQTKWMQLVSLSLVQLTELSPDGEDPPDELSNELLILLQDPSSLLEEELAPFEDELGEAPEPDDEEDDAELLLELSSEDEEEDADAEVR